MNITVKEIKFAYDNGDQNDFTGVQLNFSSTGDYSLSGPVKVAKEAFEEFSADLDKLKTLIINRVIEGLETAKVTITGINFDYDDGFNNPYTGVALNFITSGVDFSLNGPISVTKNEYKDASLEDKLKELIKDKVVADLQAA
ncbi:hypothetical protein J14TS2_17140 [Bacillus sp. J14TS2]|uniref:hypothetical protein n=1 Tax=Bacillus sp. J14TS2 TaxID=2807188 RepID=UPI001B2A2E40|nr:hypothetical protein [Bacillus sp. J14TS2]GIN71239.1 hypothetical protein J14TS2_17140 [Bacillus sp. J14TS2]